MPKNKKKAKPQRKAPVDYRRATVAELEKLASTPYKLPKLNTVEAQQAAHDKVRQFRLDRQRYMRRGGASQPGRMERREAELRAFAKMDEDDRGLAPPMSKYWAGYREVVAARGEDAKRLRAELDRATQLEAELRGVPVAALPEIGRTPEKIAARMEAERRRQRKAERKADVFTDKAELVADTEGRNLTDAERAAVRREAESRYARPPAGKNVLRMAGDQLTTVVDTSDRVLTAPRSVATGLAQDGIKTAGTEATRLLQGNVTDLLGVLSDMKSLVIAFKRNKSHTRTTDTGSGVAVATAGARPSQVRPSSRRTTKVKSGPQALAREAVDNVPATEAEAKQPSARAQTVVRKTKRGRHDLTKSMTTPELAKLDAEANRATLDKIYQTFYAGPIRKNSDDALEKQLGQLYSIMGQGSGDYVQKPVTDREFAAFLATPNAEITAQKMGSKAKTSYQERLAAYKERQKKYAESMTQWQEDRKEWQKTVQALRPDEQPPPEPVRPTKPTMPRKPPATREEAVKRGDYFHVHNKSGKLRKAGLTGRARRIIVNVNSQQAGLKVAKSMGDLFNDDNVAPYLREYKIFLSQAKATPDSTIKHDKLVIYYRVPHSAKGNDDPVGDRVVAAIKGAISSTDVGGEFAPFYARVGPGIAWAEEPKYFVDGLKGSFTQSREQIIADVIRKAAKVDDLGAFVDLVSKTLQDNFVDPANPHRHLPGNPPKRKQKAQPAPPPQPPAAPSSGASQQLPPAVSRKPVTKVSTIPPPTHTPPCSSDVISTRFI